MQLNQNFTVPNIAFVFQLFRLLSNLMTDFWFKAEYKKQRTKTLTQNLCGVLRRIVNKLEIG